MTEHYLDNSATTPLCAAAYEKMEFVMRHVYGNPSSLHTLGLEAEKIVTEYRVLQRKGDLALAEITLHTGKTHQIRAHLAFLGCPVLGDTKYGEKALNERYNKTRQCLVAKRLTLHFTESSPLHYADGKTFVSRFSLSPDDF